MKELFEVAFDKGGAWGLLAFCLGVALIWLAKRYDTSQKEKHSISIQHEKAQKAHELALAEVSRVGVEQALKCEMKCTAEKEALYRQMISDQAKMFRDQLSVVDANAQQMKELAKAKNLDTSRWEALVRRIDGMEKGG